MRPHYSPATPPDSEPITLAQATDHVRVDSEADQDYIEGLIPVAREYVEGLTGRALMQAGWLVVADSWASLQGPDVKAAIPIYRTPLVSVQSVSYYAEDADTLTVIDPADYIVVTATEPGMVKITGTLPDLSDRPDAIQITFTAGHSESVSIPPMLRHALKVDVSNRYENRNSVSFGQSYEINSAFRSLIEHQKVGGWVA
jgi:uncharacterized phiE125 gp8 family phage protein